MRCCFCFPQKIFACLSRTVFFGSLKTRKRENGKTGKRTNAQKGRRKLCKNYFVIYCARSACCLPACWSCASPWPYLFIVGLFMTSRPLAADLCSEQGAGVGTESRKQKAGSRQQKSKWGVRCVLKLLMRKLWSRSIELNWPMATPKCSPVPFDSHTLLPPSPPSSPSF